MCVPGLSRQGCARSFRRVISYLRIKVVLQTTCFEKAGIAGGGSLLSNSTNARHPRTVYVFVTLYYRQDIHPARNNLPNISVPAFYLFRQLPFQRVEISSGQAISVALLLLYGCKVFSQRIMINSLSTLHLLLILLF